MELLKDDRWSIVLPNDDPEFKSFCQSINLRPEIPKEIHQHLTRIKSVLRFCYYDYELTGVATFMSTIALEAALILKLESLDSNIELNKHITLSKLIELGEERGLFEEGFNTVDSIRKIRNYYAHQRQAGFAGYTELTLVPQIINLINSLWDDIPLRIERQQKTEYITEKFSALIQNGLILHYKNIRLIIFDMRLLLFNNLISPPLHYILFYPIFEINPNSDRIDELEPILIEGNSIEFNEENENQVVFGSDIHVTKIENNTNIDKFNDWRENYKSSKLPIEPLIELKICKIKSQLLSEHLYNANINTNGQDDN